jgi:glycosyltransferase involved in cell wall biosynthesis
MVHAWGAKLAGRRALPLVMDMRDPWSHTPGLTRATASPLWYALAERHEARAVRRAALIVTNTEPVREALQRSYPEAAGRVVTINNGCDEEPRPPLEGVRRFTVVYAGNIYIDRDPRPIFRAAAQVVREEGLGPEELEVQLIGQVAEYGGVPTLELAREAGVEGFVSLHRHCARSELFERLNRASVLVSLPQDTDLSIPSKIFEYMQFPAWLLVFAKRGSATERLLRETGADVVAPDDEGAVTEALRRRFREFRDGVRPVPMAVGGRFSRRRQAERLFDEIDRRLAGARAGDGRIGHRTAG